MGSADRGASAVRMEFDENESASFAVEHMGGLE